MKPMPNYMIDVYRALFAIMICMMHLESALFPSDKLVFEGGYLGVEYFFVLSGYLLCKAYESKKYRNAFDYTIAKIKGLMPYNIIMIVFWLVYDGYVYLAEHEMVVEEFVKWEIQSVLYALDDIFFLQMFFPSRYMNSPIWYLSALIVAGFGYYLFLEKRGRDYEIGFLVIALFTFLYQSYGHLDLHIGTSAIFKIGPGVLRGIAEMGAGILAYKLGGYIKLSYLQSCVVKGLLILGWISIIVWYPHTPLDVVFVMLSAVMIILEFKYPVHILNGRHRRNGFGWLRKITLGIYFCHFLVVQIFKRNHAFIQSLTKDAFWFTIVLFLCCTAAAAYGLCILASAFGKPAKRIETRRK